MQPLHPLRSTLAILVLAIVAAGIACALPDNPYQRWQLLDGTIHARARWIYERVHYDPTPIDVAFVGPSRMGQGVNAPRLSQALAQRGLPSNVVNFALPETGRNINYLIVQEMLKEKRPTLIVLGIMEKPARVGHSAFKYIAPADMIVCPGYLGDLNYFSDLIYLPFRQLRLFAADLAPGLAGLDSRFNPGKYRGHTVDTTGSVTLPDGAIKEGERPAALPELRRGVRKLERGTHPPLLPRSLADVEFGDERHYLREIVSMARAKGARVAFLFIPYYTGPSQLQEQSFYEGFGPVWNAGFFSSHAELFADYGHLTRTGANELTDWLVNPVATRLSNRGGAN